MSTFILLHKFYLKFWDVVPKLLYAPYLKFSRIEAQSTSQEADLN